MKQHRILVYMTLISLFITVSLLLTRVYFESRSFYGKGKESLLNDDPYMAITYFGRSAKWYFPGNPYVKQSIEGLWSAACKAEERGEIEFALKACYTLRGSLYATKWLFMHHKEWIEPCNQKIADLTVARHPYIKRAKVITGLNKEERPIVIWAFFVVICFYGWIGSALGLIFFSFDSSGSMKWRNALFWGGLVLGFFLLWIFTMFRA